MHNTAQEVRVRHNTSQEVRVMHNMSQEVRVRQNTAQEVMGIVERIHARNQTNCAFCDKSMKLGTWFLDIIRSILRNGAISDLTFGDL